MSDQRKFLHDLASPLTVLQMNLENIQMALSDLQIDAKADCENFVNSALRQAKKLEDLIRTHREILTKESQ